MPQNGVALFSMNLCFGSCIAKLGTVMVVSEEVSRPRWLASVVLRPCWLVGVVLQACWLVVAAGSLLEVRPSACGLVC